MTTRESIEAAIAALSTIENARPDIHFTYSCSRESYTRDVWDAVQALGGKLNVTLYDGVDMDAHVIESLSVSFGSVTVGVQRDRIPTRSELTRLGADATTYKEEYKTAALVRRS